MISFGELRKKSVEWQTEISTVEKIYARDWLLKGLFDLDDALAHFALKGASAFASAYFSDYPRVEDIDLGIERSTEVDSLEHTLEKAVGDAARASGLQFRLQSFQATEARVEFTGPLGRRSAAQPVIVARFVWTPPRGEPVPRPLIHPFSDTCKATVWALSPEALVAERIVLYAQKPRARDVYDLWFAVTHGARELDAAKTRHLAQMIAMEKGLTLHPGLNPAYAPLLERAWENALRQVRPHPPFQQAQGEIAAQLREILA